MLEADCALRHYTPAPTINPMQRQYHGKRARDKARAVPSRLGASGARTDRGNKREQEQQRGGNRPA